MVLFNKIFLLLKLECTRFDVERISYNFFYRAKKISQFYQRHLYSKKRDQRNRNQNNNPSPRRPIIFCLHVGLLKDHLELNENACTVL